VPKKIWVALAAAALAALAMRKSVADQQAERDLWAEATDAHLMCKQWAHAAASCGGLTAWPRTG